MNSPYAAKRAFVFVTLSDSEGSPAETRRFFASLRMTVRKVSYEEWLEAVPASLKKDSLWKFETYRKTLFVSELAWFDSEKLLATPRGKGLAWQLVESAGSVSANIEEGYGRGFGKSYAIFLRIALGSAREARGWYWRGRHAFDAKVVAHRMGLLDEIISGLVTTANQPRRLPPK